MTAAPVDLTSVVSGTPVAKLGDVPLSIAVGQQHAWTMTSGVQPFQAVFEVSTARALEIMARGSTQLSSAAAAGTRTRDRSSPVGPLSFVISSPGREELEIKGLYVISTQPGSTQNTLGLLVADRRWLWKRTMVHRSYNIRRRSGEYRVVSGAVTPAQVAQRTPDYTYRRMTLKDGVPWTARQVLEDVLLELCGAGGWVIDGPIGDDVIEGLELGQGESGDEALQRVLGFLPGVSLYPGRDGRIHVYSTLRNTEIAAASAAGKILEGTGGWTVVDRRLVRGPYVDVYFGRESEMRFDYQDDDLRSRVAGREPRSMENVLPSPDPTLTLASGRVVAAGTWITVDEALEAWALLADYPAEAGALTQATIRRYYMAGLSFMHHVFSLQDGAAEVNQTWSRRISALQEHWRRTFRILPQWMDKIRSVRAYRVAVVDQENGTRARADAYFDHVVKLGARGLIHNARGNDLGWNTTSYAEDLADAKVAPADVEVLDSDNGVLRITPRLDLGGLATAIAPGTVDEIPKATAGESTTLWAQTSLAAAWKLAVVVTIVQDAPNDLGRLHRERVSAADAAQLLGVAIGPTDGPVFDTLVSEGVETARFAWVDDEATNVEECVFQGRPAPSTLQVNPDTVRALALAQAARVYSLQLDRGEGSFSVSLNASVVPTGSLQQVTHRVAYESPERMVCATTLVMPPVMTAPSVSSLLPEGVRRVVRRLVQP